MPLSVKKAVICNKTMDVITLEEYDRLCKLPNPVYGDMCVEHDGYVFPITKSYRPEQPSVFATNVATVFTYPKTDKEKEEYSSSKIIDFDNVKNITEMIVAADKLRSAESVRLNIVNQVLELPIPESNTPELRAIKEAINSKHIDAESYKQKFPCDSDFNNDMRALKGEGVDNISFFKAKRILNAFDLDMVLTIKDKPNAVNPIGKTISVKLTGEK